MFHEDFWGIVEKEIDEDISSKYENINLKIYTQDLFDPDHYFDFLGSYKKENLIDLTLVIPLYNSVDEIFEFYISFLSQVLFTDFLNINRVLLITKPKYYDLLVRIFKPWIDKKGNESNLNITIESINVKELISPKLIGKNEKEKYPNFLIPRNIYKYFLTSFSYVRKESSIISICNPNIFFFNKKLKLYKNIVNFLKYKRKFTVFNIQNKKFDLSKTNNKKADLFYNKNEIKSWFCRRLEVSPNEFSSILNRNNIGKSFDFFFFNNSRFNDIFWKRIVKWSRLYNIRSNQLVFFPYGLIKKNYKWKTFNDFKNITVNSNTSDFKFDNLNNLIVFNNIFSEEKLEQYYNIVKNKFEKVIKKVVSNPSSLREFLQQY